MSLPIAITPGDVGHIDDHQEIHELLSRLDGQAVFLATGVLQDLLANMPAAGASNLGLFRFATDVPRLDYSTGSSWFAVPSTSAAQSWSAPQNFDDDVFFSSGRPWKDPRASVFAGGGAVGDGVADDEPAINDALSTPGTTFLSDGTYMIGETLLPVSDSELVLSAGAMVKAKNQPWGGRQGLLNVAETVSNFKLRGGTFDGNKAAGDLRVIAVQVVGGSDVYIGHIRLQNCPGQNVGGTNQGDGIYLGRHTASGAIATNIELDHVICDGNVRQGMSVCSVSGLRVFGCSFINTTGNNPGGGVDFEPNNASETIENVEFYGCHFDNNEKGVTSSASAGALMTDIRFFGGSASGNRQYGYRIDAGMTRVSIDGCRIDDNGLDGIQFSGGYAMKAINNYIRGNGENGIDCSSRGARLSGNFCFENGFHGIKLGYVSPPPGGCIVTDNQCINNSMDAANTYDGISCQGNAAARLQRHIIAHNDCINSLDFGTTAQQRYGIRLEANVVHCLIGPNVAFGNVSGDVSISEPDDNITLELNTGSTPELTLYVARGAVRFGERSDPAAPAVNSVLVYAKDDGGKTELRSRFATGAAPYQQITQEP